MTTHHQYLILGAGPAGLQLAYFLEQAGRDYLILEGADKACDFFVKYPRHRTLLSINKVYTGYDDDKINLRWDWNSLLSDDYGVLFRDYSKRFFPDADDLVRYMNDYANHYNLKIQYNTFVENVDKEDGQFIATDRDGNRYSSEYFIVATGSGKLSIPPIPGVELAETYDTMSMDPMDYANQRVLIVGKGNTAFETADYLIETAAAIHLTSPNPLKLAWKSHHVGHLRAVNNNFLDTYLLKVQNGLLEANISEIRKGENGKLTVGFNFTRAHDAYAEYDYDRVILCAGFGFDGSIYTGDAKPETVMMGRFPGMGSDWQSTNVENMYFAGTIMQMRDFKKTQSSFIHGFRYNVRTLFWMLEERNHDVAYPTSEVAVDSQELGEHFLNRMNYSPSLWHQPKFFCDAAVIDREAGKVTYYEDLPAEYLAESPLHQSDEYMTLSLEYGPDHVDFPFEFNRYADAENAHLNPQLHPIIRCFKKGELVAEHHVLEELEGRWVDDMYREPLFAFLRERIGEMETAAV